MSTDLRGAATPATPPNPAIAPLLVGLVDDAAVFPPGNAPLPDAIEAHRRHRTAGYADLVGALLVPAHDARAAADLSGQWLSVGLVGPVDDIPAALAAAGDRLDVRHIEAPVAKRREDPMPGLRSFLAMAANAGTVGYAEIPLTWGLLTALDALAEARAAGAAVAAKFRTGGLAAELFPTPVELAAVICACRDRHLPFKLTAGLHRAVRHADAETGFTHHGFLNVLTASIAAADGAEAADLAELLAGTDAQPLVDAVQARRTEQRPLWIGFGSCSIAEPVDDLRGFGLI